MTPATSPAPAASAAPALRPLAAVHRVSRAVAINMVAAACVVALAIGIGGFMPHGPLAAIGHHALDGLVHDFAASTTEPHAVVVDIDEVSLSAAGQWPWPRYRVAALIENIAAQKPAAIGLDVLFAEPDRSSLVNIQDTFKRDFGIDVAFSGVPEGLTNNDGYLGFVVGRDRVVASNYFYFDHFNKSKTRLQSGVTIDGDLSALKLDQATGVLGNIDIIASQTRATGFMNNQLDDDGMLRRVPLLIEHDGVVHPNLSLATAMMALGIKRATVERNREGPVLRVGTHRIPIDESGFATLRFRDAPARYPSISAIDVLNDRFDASDFAGKVIFLGSSAVGLNDVHDTAVDSHFPGLKVHAVVTGNLLDDRFVRVPSWAPWVGLAGSIVAGLAVAALFVGVGPVPWVVAGTLLAISSVLGASGAVFAAFGWFISPAAPIVTIAALFVGFAVTRFAIEKRRSLRWLRQLQNARQVTIESMASVAETRDPETGAHIKRTQHYVRAIANELRRSGLHLATLTDEYIHVLYLSAPLHDIGKVGVPDHILLKPARLTPEEFEIMKKHAEFGRKIIMSSSKNIEGDNFLEIAGEIAATHHEKWDGSGYPNGLAGEAIPLSGRIMATADIYDALISRRCYKEPFPHALATSLMREANGTIFDPAILAAFFRIEDEIKAIAAEYGDEAPIEVPPLPIEVSENLVGSLIGANA